MVVDQDVVILVVAGVVVAACFAIVVYAFHRAIEAFGAGGRVTRLGETLGGTVVGTQQWIAPRGVGHAGLLVVSGRTGIDRISLWSSRLTTARPGTLAGIALTYDEPLRRALRAGELDRVVLRRRSRWLRPSARTRRVLGDLARDLRFSSTANDDVVVAILARPEIRDRVRGALAVGFDELILYPPDGGVELVACSPRVQILDAEIVRAALGWIEPMG